MIKLTMTTKNRELAIRIMKMIEKDKEYSDVHMLKLDALGR
ncbi:hypothetical protein [Sulfuricurvum sp.]